MGILGGAYFYCQIRVVNGLEKEKRVKELDEFYDMAVGREMRMKELKKEIRDLKEELEKYKKK